MTSAVRRRPHAAARFWTGLLALGVAVAGVVGAASAAQGAERGPVRRAAAPLPSLEAEARVIVKFREETRPMQALANGAAGEGTAASGVPPTTQRAAAWSARLGLDLTDGRSLGPRTQVLKARGLRSAELAERLAAQAEVEYAVVDGRQRALAVPNDPLYRGGQSGSPATGQWYLRPPTSATIVDASSVVASINAQGAWDITTGNPAIVVAVLDTGTRLDHPDLAGKLVPGYDFINDAGVAADGDARDADPSDPGDFGCEAGELSSWHGTQTAGLIGAATNNGIGMAGSGYNVKVLPVRVLGKCGGFDSDIQAGMRWAAGLSNVPRANPNPAKVLNMSLGSSGTCNSSYVDVVAELGRAGVVVVAAAGNDGLAVGTPASCPGVIAVAGLRHAGTKVGYSDLGPQISIAAPAGNCVNVSGECLYPLLTLSNSGTTTPVAGAAGAVYTTGGSDASIGTSFSAPLVAGTVGLMLSANPTLTPAEVLGYLKSTARPFPVTGAGQTQHLEGGPFFPVTACVPPESADQPYECYCTTSTCGAGMLDAAAAVAAAATRIVANIGVASTQTVVGDSVVLDAARSRPTPGANTLVTYLWEIVDGADKASITSAANAVTATLRITAPGLVTVRLSVTDSTGTAATNTVTLKDAVTVVAPPLLAEESSGGGGGGAMTPAWLLAWLAATLAVWAVTPRPTRRRRDGRRSDGR